MQINETEVRKAISTIIGDGNLFECRIIYNDSKAQPSAYFRSADNLIRELKRTNLQNANVYIVLNPLKETCSGREQFDHFMNGKTSTGDDDVKARDWILIDLDPNRPSKTSSTQEQVDLAFEKAKQVYKFLKNEGFTEPIVAFSGNGYHLLYKVHLRNSTENTALVKKFLDTLKILFTDEEINIDTDSGEWNEKETIGIDASVSNPSRICKLYGTVAQKGRHTKEQPHRMSYIKHIPKEILPVDKAYIAKVANCLDTEKPKPNRYNGYDVKKFDLEEWLNKHGIRYKLVVLPQFEKFILDHCPFNESHKGKDAVIFRFPDGRICFKCFHNSCSDKKWRDVRLLYEPDAYSKDRSEEYYRSTLPNRKNHNMHESAPIVEIENKPIFLTAKQILEKPNQEQVFVKTGIEIIDKKMRGLMKGHVSVWSGLRASAKSTVLSQTVLRAVNDDNTVIVYSGELSDKNFMKWMNQQAAGHYNEPSLYEGYFNTPIAIQKKIADWLGDKFYLYDNGYGNDFSAVIAKIEEQIEKTKADLVVLDNLMSFNITSLGYTKWDAQSAFVWKLHEDARKYNVHIAFVAHPKKAAGFLRFDDISGTADIGNAVDDAFIVHRNNEDFKRLTREMFKWKDDNEIYQGTNVIEIVKDRDGGNQDVFIPLYYEQQSKRLKNSIDENIVYGWDTSEGWEDVPKAVEVNAMDGEWLTLPEEGDGWDDFD